MAKKSKRSGWLKPAELVAARFGGVRKAGRLLGSEFLVSRWINRGGYIPNAVNPGTKRNWHEQLMQVAKENRIKLCMDEILNGGMP